MTISPVNHLRNHVEDRSNLEDAVSTLQEYTCYLQGVLSELTSNADVTPTDLNATGGADDESECELNAIMNEASDTILGAALDVASLLNKAAKSELRLRITNLESSAPTSSSERERLETALAALHVPHKLECPRSIYGAEATVQTAGWQGPSSETRQVRARRVIERGKKAMTKEAA